MPCSASLGCSINSIVSWVTDPSVIFSYLSSFYFSPLYHPCNSNLKAIQRGMSTKFFSKQKYYCLRYNQDLGIELQTLITSLLQSNIVHCILAWEAVLYIHSPQWFSFLGPSKSLMLQIKCNPWLPYKDQPDLFTIMNFSISVLHQNSKSEDFTTTVSP